MDVVIDSSKNLSWVRDAYRWASADDMTVQVVVPWRGPKGIAYSYWKREAPEWATNLEGYFRRLNDLGIPGRPLLFDDLISDPSAALETVYEPLGLRSEPGQEQFWKGDFHSLFGSGGTREQVVSGTSVLSAPVFPPEFEDYWSSLPGAMSRRLEVLDEQVRHGKVNANTRGHIPPKWYVKHRAINLRDRTLLTLRPGSDIR